MAQGKSLQQDKVAVDSGQRLSPLGTDSEKKLFTLEQLVRGHPWFSTIVDQVSDYLFVKDRECRFVLANSAVARDLGFESPLDLLGKSDLELHPPETGQKFYADEQEIMRTGQPKVDYEEYIYRADGKRRWFSSSKFPLRSDDGEIFGVFGVARDVTDRKKASMLREGQTEVLEMIAVGAPLQEVLTKLVMLIEEQLEGVLCSVLLLDENTGCLSNGAAPNLPDAYCEAIEGIEIGPTVGSCGTAAYHKKTVIVEDIETDPLWADFSDLALGHGLRSCWSTPILSLDGRVLGTFALYTDHIFAPGEKEVRLTIDTVRIAAIAIERELSEQKIRYLANVDSVTGLPNRNALKTELVARLDVKRGRQDGLMVIFFDLDKFKSINDSLGHAAGDELLRIVGERVKVNLSRGDFLARFGGDEFVLVVRRKNKGAAAVETLLNKIQNAISEPVVLEGQSLHVTTSMGIARYPYDGTDRETLLKNADAAMYKAKDRGRNNHQFYTPCMSTGTQETLSLLENMRAGIPDRQFFLEFQPQFDLGSMKMTGSEALVRWQHPELGRLAPDRFIPLAEESGLILRLGRWVLNEACRHNVALQAVSGLPLKVAVNVSARQFSDASFQKDVEHALEASGLQPEHLELELTESLLMLQPDQGARVMGDLQRLGVQIAIDDFGTGYSSLSALRTFPISRLKIDQTFVRDMTGKPGNAGIAKAVIALGHDLGMRVIAEGVETGEQLERLVELGCDEAQGYFTGRPQTRAQIEILLADRKQDQLANLLLQP